MPINAKPHTGLQHRGEAPAHPFNAALRIIVAGGSTGGHLFPGIAIAEEFIERNPDNRVLFAGTGRPLERRILKAKGLAHRALRAEGLKGRGLVNQIRALVKLPLGLFDAFKILNAFRPHLVLGMGGYSAGPMALAARIYGIAVVLHEQNRIPGITNRLSASLARRIYLSYTDDDHYFEPHKVCLAGNPVRREIIACRAITARTSALSNGERPFTILVVGGSQGAHGINMAVVESLARLKMRDDLRFIHQTGSDDEKTVRAAYQHLGIDATVKAFFNDMAQQYRHADLIICRAGATTVAELTVIGKGVIFVPYPFAADNHQVFNAQPLVDLGAAEMILEKDLTGEILAERITHFIAFPEELEQMAARARHLGRPAAATTIVDDCYALLAASRL